MVGKLSTATLYPQHSFRFCSESGSDYAARLALELRSPGLSLSSSKECEGTRLTVVPERPRTPKAKQL